MSEADFEVNSKEIEKLASDLSRFSSKARSNIERRGLRKFLRTVLDKARTAAPLGDTGTLKSSFSVSVSSKRGQIRGSVKSNAPHAHLVEFGFIHTGPKPNKKKGEKVEGKPFLRPAIYENQGELAQDFSRIIMEEIAKQLKKDGGFD